MTRVGDAPVPHRAAPRSSAPVEGRVATEADVASLLDMTRDFFAGEDIPFEPEAARVALEGLLGNSSIGRAWVFEEAGARIGYAVATYGYDLEFNGRDALLTDVYLVPECRGRGVGEELMAFVEREAKAAGVHALHLMVDPSNTRAVRLYQKAHFEKTHRIMMTKRLS